MVRPEAMRFTDTQLRTISTIFADLGQVCAAGMVVPYFVDRVDLVKGVTGLIFASLFWIMSVLFSKERS